MEPPPAFRISGDRRGGAEEDAGGVHGHNAVPEVAGGVLDSAGAAHSGVVDQDVQRTECLDRGLYGGAPLLLAGDVERDVEDASAGGLELGFQGRGPRHRGCRRSRRWRPPGRRCGRRPRRGRGAPPLTKATFPWSRMLVPPCGVRLRVGLRPSAYAFRDGFVLSARLISDRHDRNAGLQCHAAVCQLPVYSTNSESEGIQVLGCGLSTPVSRSRRSKFDIPCAVG